MHIFSRSVPTKMVQILSTRQQKVIYHTSCLYSEKSHFFGEF